MIGRYGSRQLVIGLVGTIIVLVSIYSQNVNKTERAVSSIIGIGF